MRLSVERDGVARPKRLTDHLRADESMPELRGDGMRQDAKREEQHETMDRGSHGELLSFRTDRRHHDYRGNNGSTDTGGLSAQRTTRPVGATEPGAGTPAGNAGEKRRDDAGAGGTGGRTAPGKDKKT